MEVERRVKNVKWRVLQPEISHDYRSSIVKPSVWFSCQLDLVFQCCDFIQFREENKEILVSSLL